MSEYKDTLLVLVETVDENEKLKQENERLRELLRRCHAVIYNSGAIAPEFEQAIKQLLDKGGDDER